MSFSNLSSAQVTQLIKLIKKKESIQSRLDRVNQQLESIESGGSTPAPVGGKKRGRKPGSGAAKVSQVGRGKKRGKRLKVPLLAALKSAGAGGMTVKDLSAKLKVKPGNVFSWFYTTGKKIKGISKVGEAKYSYTG